MTNPTPTPAELVEKWRQEAREMVAPDRALQAHDCADELAASLAAHGRVEVTDALRGAREFYVRMFGIPFDTENVKHHSEAHRMFAAIDKALAALEKTP
jgi:hypothetical protein